MSGIKNSVSEALQKVKKKFEDLIVVDGKTMMDPENELGRKVAELKVLLDQLREEARLQRERNRALEEENKRITQKYEEEHNLLSQKYRGLVEKVDTLYRRLGNIRKSDLYNILNDLDG